MLEFREWATKHYKLNLIVKINDGGARARRRLRDARSRDGDARVENGRAAAGDGGTQMGRTDHRHPPRRRSDAREGALFFAAQRAIRMGLQGSAAGVLGTIRDGSAQRANTSACSRCSIGPRVDIWRYIQRENIPIPKMYFARERQTFSLVRLQPDHEADRKQRRQRSTRSSPNWKRRERASAPAARRIITSATRCRSCARRDSCERTKAQRLKVVFVGHVDHGKSTLIGRILHDTDSLPEGKIDSIQKACAAEGMEFEYAFLLDALARGAGAEHHDRYDADSVSDGAAAIHDHRRAGAQGVSEEHDHRRVERRRGHSRDRGE